MNIFALQTEDMNYMALSAYMIIHHYVKSNSTIMDMITLKHCLTSIIVKE